MRFRPYPQPLKRVIWTLIAVCLVLVASSLRLALNGNYLPLGVSALLWLPLGWGLWRMHRMARRVAVGLLWVIVVVLPIGIINPFAAMDGRVSIDTPSWQLAVPVFSLVAIAVYMLHILGKHKAAFGREAED